MVYGVVYYIAYNIVKCNRVRVKMLRLPLAATLRRRA